VHRPSERRIAFVPGETDLGILLREMKPELTEGEYVFCSVPQGDLSVIDVESLGQFHEEEGLTLILRRRQAEELGLAGEFLSRMITLTIHSSLEAVGLLAAVTRRLAENGIPVNAVSAYYHDHLFVPVDRAEEALSLLRELSRPEC
jgi:hypothetical protein